MTSPPVLGRVRGIVIGIVVTGDIDRRALFHIAVVFLFQRAAVVFKVVEHIKRAVRRVFNQTGPGLGAGDQRV